MNRHLAPRHGFARPLLPSQSGDRSSAGLATTTRAAAVTRNGTYVAVLQYKRRQAPALGAASWSASELLDGCSAMYGSPKSTVAAQLRERFA